MQVTVYVQSQQTKNISYYRYSTSENRTIQDLADDEAEWRNSGQLKGDLRSFNMMSGYVAGVAESPIYFCSTEKNSGTLKTRIHFVSKKPCKRIYKLEFYLYANVEMPSNAILNFTRLWVMSEGEKDSKHSRIFMDIINITVNASKYISIYIPSTSDEEQSFRIALPTEDPCGSHLQRVRAPVGVISSPLFPDPYPREPKSIYCRWRLNMDEGSLIRIKFTNMDLVKGPNYDKNIFSAETVKFLIY